jgi:hypothetical protein
MKMPLEFYSPESFGFLSILALPHLAWGRALLLWGLIVYLRGKRVRSGLLNGCIWLLLGFMQPLTVVTAWTVQAVHLMGWSLWIFKGGNSKWKDWRNGIIRVLFSVLVSAPLVLYNFAAFQIDPFLRRWQARNLIPSPPTGDYLLAYAVVLPLVAAGLWAWRNSLTVEKLLPISWMVAFPFLAYAPYNLQRRLPEGIWVTLCVLAIAGLEIMPKRWRIPLRLGLALAFMSTLLLYLSAIAGIVRPSVPVFRPYAETQAMDFLSQRVEKNAVVLAAYDTSTVLPTRAPVHVLIGHGPESLDLEKVQPRVEKFFSSGTKNDRENLLSEFSVAYVFYGPIERTLGDWDPGSADFLSEIYQDGEYAIYRVEGLSK